MSPRPEERAFRIAEVMDTFAEAYPDQSAEMLHCKPAFRELQGDFEKALDALAETMRVDARRPS